MERLSSAKDSSFWASIGSPCFVMGPMVDASELAFRILSRRCGVELAYTPMLHSRLFVEDSKYRAAHWQVLPSRRRRKVKEKDHEEQEEQQRHLLYQSSNDVDNSGQLENILNEDVCARAAVAEQRLQQEGHGCCCEAGTMNCCSRRFIDSQRHNQIGEEAAAVAGGFPFVLEEDSDWPLIAQFCGDSPHYLTEAARLIENEVEAIDLNLGCPQNIARRGHYGAFLLRETDLISNIVSTLHASVSVPITCKIRKLSSKTPGSSKSLNAPGFSEQWSGSLEQVHSRSKCMREEEKYLQDTLNLCYRIEAAGCAALCVHGRSKEEKAAAIAAADWLAIRIIRQRLGIPVIANGGIETFQDALDCLKYTGAHAVMSAEGILDNPLLFFPASVVPSNASLPPSVPYRLRSIFRSFSSTRSNSSFVPFSFSGDDFSGGSSATVTSSMISKSTLCSFPDSNRKAFIQKTSRVASKSIGDGCAVHDIAAFDSKFFLQFAVPHDYTRCLLMAEYLNICAKHPPPHPSCMKSHIFRCLFSILAEDEMLRETLGKASTLEEFRNVVEQAAVRAAAGADLFIAAPQQQRPPNSHLHKEDLLLCKRESSAELTTATSDEDENNMHFAGVMSFVGRGFPVRTVAARTQINNRIHSSSNSTTNTVVESEQQQARSERSDTGAVVGVSSYKHEMNCTVHNRNESQSLATLLDSQQQQHVYSERDRTAATDTDSAYLRAQTASDTITDKNSSSAVLLQQERSAEIPTKVSTEGTSSFDVLQQQCHQHTPVNEATIVAGSELAPTLPHPVRTWYRRYRISSSSHAKEQFKKCVDEVYLGENEFDEVKETTDSLLPLLFAQ